MVICVVACAAFLAAGFGLGRVKNAAKLKAVDTTVAKYEASATAEVKTLVAEIKAKL